MATVSYRLEDLKKAIVGIGYVGENDHMHVLIDCKEVFDEYPDAVPTMAIVPPVGEGYPKAVTRNGDVVEWLVKDSDVTVEGDGEFQLTFTEGEIIRKSVNGRFRVKRSISGSGSAPSGVQDWLTDANEKLAEVEEATRDAEAAANHQPYIGIDGYWYTWNGEEFVKNVKAQGDKGDPGDPGSPGDPTQLIDDTAGEGQTEKTWSADKLDSEFGSVLSGIHGLAVTPEMYGAKGDGVTDDSQAVQDAIDAGYNIRFDDNKTYYLASTLNIDHDCHLFGGKNTVIKTKTPQGGFANTAFNIHGTLKKTTSLTSNYTTAGGSLSNAGDRFQFTDMEDIAIGDIMVIEATDQFYSYARDYYYLGGTLLVSDVNDNYVFSCDALPFEIENTENVTVKIYDAPSVKIEGIKFESDGETAGEYIYSVVMQYCKNSEIKDCSITKMDNGLRIHNCVNTLVDCVTVSKMPLSGTGRALDHYGIAIYSSTNTTIQRVMLNAANSSIDMSGTIPNINTRIKLCNLCALSRHDGLGMHENSYNTIIEDCVIGGLLAFGSVTVNRCKFIRSYRVPSQIGGISFRGTHIEDCSWLHVYDCNFVANTIPITIVKPYTQDNPQPFHHVIREVIVENCNGGMFNYTATTDSYVLSNVIKKVQLVNWQNCYEFYHTETALIDCMTVQNCTFEAKRWINDHANNLATKGIRFLSVKSDYPREDKVFIDIDKYGDTIYLPKDETINCVTSTATDHFVVCGKNIESDNPSDFMVGYANGSVGGDLSRYAYNEFNNSLSVNEQGEIVFTQPNTTTKAYIFPVCLAYVRKNRYVKMSCKLKNTGNTSGAQFRAYMAVVSCETGKLTYANNGTTATATAEGEVVTHSREITEDSLVLCYLYCNSPVANAQTTLSEFVAEIQEYDFLTTLTYEKYDGSSRDGEGTLLSVEGLNNILVNASGSFNVRTKANLAE